MTLEVFEEVDHRQLVWTIPKALRSAFRRDRKLLGELCRCAWQTLREYVEAVLGPGYTVGAIFAIQTWGDQLNWHPHIHALVSDGAWTQDGVSFPFGGIDSAVLTRLFSAERAGYEGFPAPAESAICSAALLLASLRHFVYGAPHTLRPLVQDVGANFTSPSTLASALGECCSHPPKDP